MVYKKREKLTVCRFESVLPFANTFAAVYMIFIEILALYRILI